MKGQFMGANEKKMDTLGTHNIDRDKVYQSKEEDIKRRLGLIFLKQK